MNTHLILMGTLVIIGIIGGRIRYKRESKHMETHKDLVSLRFSVIQTVGGIVGGIVGIRALILTLYSNLQQTELDKWLASMNSSQHAIQIQYGKLDRSLVQLDMALKYNRPEECLANRSVINDLSTNIEDASLNYIDLMLRNPRKLEIDKKALEDARHILSEARNQRNELNKDINNPCLSTVVQSGAYIPTSGYKMLIP